MGRADESVSPWAALLSATKVASLATGCGGDDGGPKPPEGVSKTPLRSFGLQTEPWLFTFDRSGRVAARLEGSFGVRGFERAIQAALR
jgi:hypothetical protein